MKVLKKRRQIILGIIIGLLIIGILFYFNLNKQKADKECSIDSDCVPTSCCHADSCVAKLSAPDCSGIFCSMVCSGLLDCGAGQCSCINSKCKVVSNKK
ncbi:MAG: hypothetical protein KJ646_06005 [Nanoarchaeota archaeon]|nr:hypothetical protein [Nanoarchaeota archaeon]